MKASYLLAGIEWILFCRLVLGEKFAPFSKGRVLFYISAAFLLLGQSIYDAALLFPLLMLYLLFVVFPFKIWEGIRVWLITFLLISIMELGIGYFLKNFIDDASLETEQILCEGIMVLFSLFYHMLVIEKPVKRLEHLSNRIWGVIVSILLAVEIMMVYFMNILQDTAAQSNEKTGAIVVLLGMAGICGMVSLCFYLFHHAQKYRMHNEFAEKYNRQQKEYFTRLLEKEQDTRQFRHDIDNHLVSMKGLAERKEYAALEAYVDELSSEIHRISRMQYDVGNDIVNTIINYYFLPIREECEIRVSGYMDDAGGILQTDLCICISNLAQNAVEAVEHVEQEKKKIGFMVSQGKQYLNFRIENTVSGKVELKEGDWPETIKEDKKSHGMGLRNVRKTVEKYGGNFEIHIEDGYFIAELYIRI